MRKVLDLLSKNFFIKHSVIILVLITFLLLVVFTFLRIYTNHGKGFAVPDLTGVMVKEAGEILEEKKLKYEVIDSVYMINFEKGAVVEQVPEPEFKVKKNRTIFLTINAHTSEKVIMPNLVGYSYRQATAELTGRGLEVGRLIYYPDIAKDMVLKQRYGKNTISEGDTIEKGSKIDLVIGNGGSNVKVMIPDLLEMNYYQAKNKLNASSLNLGAGIYDNSVITMEDSLSAIIFKQKPEAGVKKKYTMGSFVDIWLTVDSTKMPGYDSLQYIQEKNQDNLYETE